MITLTSTVMTTSNPRTSSLIATKTTGDGSLRVTHHAARFVCIVLASILGACSSGGQSSAPVTPISDASLPSPELVAVPQTAPSAPLLQKAHLTYAGAFRMPAYTFAAESPSIAGAALAFDPTRGSLFATGPVRGAQTTMEISVPMPGTASTPDGLPRATLLQAAVDPTEGLLATVLPVGSDPSYAVIGGHLVSDGRLLVSGYNFYDATNSQVVSHFSRPATLSTRGNVNGPVRVGLAQYARWVAGYMGHVPSEWQAALGGKALTGLAGISITNASSVGPSAWVFDPAALSNAPTAEATLLVGYSIDTPLGPGHLTQNPQWNATSSVRGVVFPQGTRSVLFLGRHGQGPVCYGTAEACGNPDSIYKGYHAYPYVFQVWAYDASDLAAVRRGTKAASAVVPYSIWTFELPFGRAGSERHLLGAAYDPATRRLFVSQYCGEADCSPLIHVFNVAQPAS